MTADGQSPAMAREVALDLVGWVLDRGQPFDEALAHHPRLRNLSQRDRGFVRLLAATTFRRLIQIDRAVGRALDRGLRPSAHTLRNILRLGAAQILFLQTAPHAAVDTAVDLARRAGENRARGLVNAVLRRIDREGRAAVAAEDATRINTPDWLWESWRAAYGEETCRAIAAAHLREPPLDIVIRPPGDLTEWAAKLGGSVLPTGTIRLAREKSRGGPIEELPGFSDGAWWVQDAAAALPARLLLLALGHVQAPKIADLCAAPGGKTMQLAAAGADVVALDRSPARIERLKANLARLSLNATAIVADAADWRLPGAEGGRFDGVLLDAPCTATGTIRRHPDLPHLKTAQDVTRMTVVQDRLLRAGAAMVRPGGVLVYAVCSLQPEEGPEIVARFLATESGREFARLPIGAGEIGGLAKMISGSGDLRTLPCHLASAGAGGSEGETEGGIDGFYAARLRRRA